MKIYTRSGDRGQTALRGGVRTAKDSPRIEAYGTVDELCAALGIARCSADTGPLADQIEALQHELFELGAELADPRADAAGRVGPAAIERLEKMIDRLEEGLPPLREFILPGGSGLASQLHFARTVCRRAERRVVALAAAEAEPPPSEHVVAYLNRLGDLLFVMARAANAMAGGGDVVWQKRS